MATAQNQNGNIGQQGQQGQQGQTQQGSSMQGVGSPITNEAYNVITALQAKLEGLEAYRKYTRDGGNEIWKNLAQTEMQAVEKLVGELERLVKDGKLRMREPGNANR